MEEKKFSVIAVVKNLGGQIKTAAPWAIRSCILLSLVGAVLCLLVVVVCLVVAGMVYVWL